MLQNLARLPNDDALRAVLQSLVTGARTLFGDQFVGAYLHGSLAISDFDASSDIDFLIVTEAEIDDAQLARLQEMHSAIHDGTSVWAKRLDGSYITRQTLQHYDPNSPPSLYLDNGTRVLVRSHHDDTLIVRWVLREHGITLAGPEPRSLIEPVITTELCRQVRSMMHDWTAEIFADPHAMNNRWYQPYAVLSYCRMLSTLHTGTITSKRNAAQWAQSALPDRWHGLIRRAWTQRAHPELMITQPADPHDFAQTLDFIRYVQESARDQPHDRMAT